ncbi:TonB family protein [Simiduia sp. 21SJ11W-1]|uniref:M56 family metallopeptidase n=1 Tax=Simiduia sp. 21SJ11W-1 TaxID=2909669 RepID=UPI0020A13F66|nr:M56 family metallopeptidase [Simiduia sp. 21SJ11W-1]UTA48244.1 TonB family protein [Simiduia sp. 21SJ11W-1]
MPTLDVLLLLVVKPVVLIALAWWLIAQEQRRSASHSHLLTTGLLWGLPLLCVLAIWLPGITLHSQWLAGTSALWRQPVWQSLSEPAVQAVLAVYLFGLLFCVFYQCLGYALLARVSAGGRSIHSPQLTELASLTAQPLPRLKVCSAVTGPQTWGWRRPEILVPVNFHDQPEPLQTLALLHELGHIQRRDWLINQLSRAVCALFWYLPPVWWLAYLQQQQAERATDDWVLARGQRPSDYAELLISSARALRAESLPTQALTGSLLFQRVSLLLDDNLDREPRQAQSALQAALVVGASALLIGAVQVAPQATAMRPTLMVTLMPKEVQAAESRLPASGDTSGNTPSAHPDRQALTQVPRQPGQPRPAALETVRVIAARPQRPAARDLATEVRVGRPQFANVMPLELVTPAYPQRAIKRGIEGTVTLAFAIAPDGRPQDIRVQSSPHPWLSQAAAQALAQSRYARPRLHQQPFTLTGLTEQYRFSLTTEPPDT